jgi:catalase
MTLPIRPGMTIPLPGHLHAQRDRLVEQVSGSLLGGVRGDVLERAFWYWQSIDPDVGKRIEEKVREGAAPEPVEGMGES